MSPPGTLEKARRFHDLHAAGCFVMPNAWDAGSARLLTALGFEAIGTTSAGSCWSGGRRDGAGSRDEVLDNAASIAAATHLPVSVDLMDGFGRAPETVAETIRLAAERGLVGGSIEDLTGDPAAPLYDRTLASERIAAAVEAASALSHPFVLCARADGLFARACGLDEVIARLQLFEAAGAHLLYAPALMKLADVRRVVASVSRPVNVLAGIGNEGTVSQLAEAGVRRISVGSALYGVAAGAVERAALELRNAGTFSWSGGRKAYRDVEALMQPGGAEGES
jgi:2-methylisocitrate lyase-like PEP mutase family enzyme